MNLKNPDLFRSWLIRQLEPICKANPEPVSKYVCALLKKEKSDDELRASLVSQLDIFLDSVTEEFVTFLVDVLKEEKYMTNDANFRVADAARSETEDHVELQIEAKMEETPEKEKSERKSPSPIQPPTPSPPRKATRAFSPRPRRSNFRNERRRPGATRRSRREASHSLSPSGERRQAMRKRSASGSSGSSNKSPRRSWIASRSSDTAAKKYKHHHFSRISPPGARSRSPSPPLKLHRRRAANSNFRKRPPQQSMPRSNSDNDRNHSPVKRAPPPFVNDIPELPPSMIAKADLPVDRTPPHISFGPQKQRCVDFESKGYCARGDMCAFDHGPSPIVLDNNLLNGIVPIPPPPMHHPNSFGDPIAYTPQFVNAPPTVFPPSKPYRPEAPHQAPSAVSNRELISVPTVPLPHKGKNAHYAGKPSYGHVFSSLPPGVSQTTIELTNVPAELNNIPDLYDNFSTFGALTLIQAKRNNDAGTALLTFSNATEAALAFINVDSTAMPNAKPAWYADKCIMTPFPRKSIPAGGLPNSAKSYVINRKVPPATTVAASPTAGSVAPATDIQSPSSPPSGAVPKLGAEKPKLQASPTSVIDEKSRLANEKMRQDPGRLLSDLIKKKRELLEKQLASRKEIVDKMKSLEAGNKDEKMWQDVLRKLNEVIADNENSIKVSLQQRKEYLQKMNIVPMDSAALNNLKTKQVATVNAPPVPVVPAAVTPPPKETQHQAVSSASKPDQVESTEAELGDSLDENIFGTEEDFSLLDDELDDDEDEDEVESTTTAVPAKSSQSAATAADTSSNSVGKSASSTGTPSTPEYTRVVVSGFENGDEDDLLQHFSKFGTILDKEFDNTIPSATLVYDNRKSAEEAKKEGRNFQDRLLSVNLFSSKKFQPFPRRSTTSSTFKPQEYVPYSSFSAAATGGNPYKYKNPQISAAPPAPRISGHRSVYSFRAENKARLVSAQALQPSFVSRGAGDVLKFVDEDALLSDDNLMESSD